MSTKAADQRTKKDSTDEASVERQEFDEQLGVTPFQIRQRILGAKTKPVIEEVDLGWGFPVYVRGLTASQRDKWEAAQVSVSKGGKVEYHQDNIRASLVARCLCTPDGEPVMSADDVGGLGQFPAQEIDRLYEVAKRLSGISQKDVDELEGNLGKDNSAGGW